MTLNVAHCMKVQQVENVLVKMLKRKKRNEESSLIMYLTCLKAIGEASLEYRYFQSGNEKDKTLLTTIKIKSSASISFFFSFF